MFCEKCGQQLGDNDAFCMRCGHKVMQVVTEPVATEAMASEVSTTAADVTDAVSNEPVQQPQQFQTQYQPQPTPQQPKKISKGVIIGIVIAVVALIVIGVVGFVISNRKTTVDLANYYNITFEGTAPYGTAYAEFDDDKFIADYTGKIKNNGMPGSPEGMVRNFIEESGLYDYDLDQSEYLSNGDKVTLTVNVNEEVALKGYKVLFANKTISEDVTGLGEYVSSIGQIDDVTLGEMKAIAENGITDSVNGSLTYYYTDMGQEYLGGMVLSSQEGDSYYNNWVILVYKYSVAMEDMDWHEVKDAYWFSAFPNVIKDGEDRISYDDTEIYSSYNVGDYYYFYSEPEEYFYGNYFNLYGNETLEGLKDNLLNYYLSGYDVTEDAVIDKNGSVIADPHINDQPDVEEPDEEAEETEDDEDAEDEDSEEGVDGYEGILIPDILERELTEDEIEDMSDDDIQTAINDLSALAGYKFTKKKELNKYYKQFDWYKPKKGKTATEETLGTTGYNNYQALTAEREERKE